MEGRNVIIDERIASTANRFLKRQLLVDDEAVVFGKKRIALADVEAVAYQVIETRAAGVVRTATRHNFHLWGRDGTHIVVLTASVPLQAKMSRQAVDVFDALVGFSRQVIEPRLRERIISRVVAGTPLIIGPLTIANDGISVDRKLRDDRAVPWTSYVGTDFAHGAVRVHADTGGGSDEIATVPMDKPNAVLLPELLGQLAAGTK